VNPKLEGLFVGLVDILTFEASTFLSEAFDASLGLLVPSTGLALSTDWRRLVGRLILSLFINKILLLNGRMNSHDSPRQVNPFNRFKTAYSQFFG
jgi:hypothetical protein